MHPDWLGSPQHVVAGLLVALLVGTWGLRAGHGVWAALALAVGVTMALEALVEIAEYPALHRGSADAGDYYDTIADLASSLAGALVGAAAALLVERRDRR